jgi:hypothetical protein
VAYQHRIGPSDHLGGITRGRWYVEPGFGRSRTRWEDLFSGSISPIQLHDGKYIRELSRKGYFAGILKKSVVYHATGPYWAAAYGYKKMWEVKYRRNYKSLLPLIDNVRIDEVPSVQYARAMVMKAQQSYGSGA